LFSAICHGATENCNSVFFFSFILFIFTLNNSFELVGYHFITYLKQFKVDNCLLTTFSQMSGSDFFWAVSLLVLLPGAIIHLVTTLE